MMAFSLFDDLVATLSGGELSEFRAEYSLRGYCLVGSMPLLRPRQDDGTCQEQSATESDVDLVLLADGSDETTPSTPLPELADLLSRTERLRSCSIWYVHALVPIVKIQVLGQSVDLSWVDGCWIHHRTTNFRFRQYAVDDPDRPVPAKKIREKERERGTGVLHLPKGLAFRGPVSCIRLTRLFLRILASDVSCFTLAVLNEVRSWAKARHIYGSRYG